MDTNLSLLRNEIDELEARLKTKKALLENCINSCQHRWSDPIYDPIYTPGYTIPGDELGTMGVDYHGPIYVSATNKPQWSRTCIRCGKVEKTTKTISGPAVPRF